MLGPSLVARVMARATARASWRAVMAQGNGPRVMTCDPATTGRAKRGEDRRPMAGEDSRPRAPRYELTFSSARMRCSTPRRKRSSRSRRRAQTLAHAFSDRGEGGGAG